KHTERRIRKCIARIERIVHVSSEVDLAIEQQPLDRHVAVRVLDIESRLERMGAVSDGQLLVPVHGVLEEVKRKAALISDGRRVGNASEGGVGQQPQRVVGGIELAGGKPYGLALI